jgi:glycosyltransferase involved in cell wall biosynthesis
VPSREEPFGIVLIEAMAEALPVIVTDTDGPSYIVRDGVTGLIVQRENNESLAQAIMVSLEKPSDMAAKGVAGYQDIKARFSREAVGLVLKAAISSFPI